jgi:hypothetical protein
MAVDDGPLNKQQRESVEAVRSEQKTTVELPKTVLAELGMMIARSKMAGEELSLKKVISRAIKLYLKSNLDWSNSEHVAMWSFKLSDDPEDRLELECTVDSLKSLFVSVVEALQNAGENPEELIKNMERKKL